MKENQKNREQMDKLCCTGENRTQDLLVSDSGRYQLYETPLSRSVHLELKNQNKNTSLHFHLYYIYYAHIYVWREGLVPLLSFLSRTLPKVLGLILTGESLCIHLFFIPSIPFILICLFCKLKKIKKNRNMMVNSLTFNYSPNLPTRSLFLSPI